MQISCGRFLIFGRNDHKRKVVRNFPNLELSGETTKKKVVRNYFGEPRIETTFVKWSPSRKRLRTTALSACLSVCLPVCISLHVHLSLLFYRFLYQHMVYRYIFASVLIVLRMSD